MERTYRVTVRGRFTDLTSQQRTRLLAEQSDHGLFSATFSREGTFLYGPELAGYQFRSEVVIDEPDPVDAETLARMQAEDHATTDLENRGFQGRIVDVSAVCMNDIRVRRGSSRS
ncbi:DUF6204 family protein [Nocardiopsis sp. JB363]|uniref:DUF6204 family protein n=1 Tax=Nocardiopsis sp. JB363 TaxID=1434837 RepID=UPI000979D547|nr:DUF6204 family protein [Nocardiopsis sp. JB363]SIO84207.1 hypothetical protein BQ8420_00725 [Nocardiopsis sp. JB363]